jgi:hypothetical protein
MQSEHMSCINNPMLSSGVSNVPNIFQHSQATLMFSMLSNGLPGKPTVFHAFQCFLKVAQEQVRCSDGYPRTGEMLRWLSRGTFCFTRFLKLPKGFPYKHTFPCLLTLDNFAILGCSWKTLSTLGLLRLSQRHTTSTLACLNTQTLEAKRKQAKRKLNTS